MFDLDVYENGKTRRVTIRQVRTELSAALEASGLSTDGVWSNWTEMPEDNPFPEGRIACFAVPGGSEGWYTHVEVLLDGKTRLVFLCKTFDGYPTALAVSNLFSRVLMDWKYDWRRDGFEPIAGNGPR